MKCPICKLDLDPLDLVSRHEHVELCLENGPSVVDVDTSGQLVVKKSIPLAKQRKICPICDKTFQNLHSHFKNCALKYDVPPNLMIDHWEAINSSSKTQKKFPRDLLDSFVAKCVKEGRVGEQVDFARALSLSMAEDVDLEQATYESISANQAESNLSEPSSARTLNSAPLAVVTRPETSRVRPTTKPTKESAKTVTKKKYRLETADESIKKANIELRIDRELVMSRKIRYQQVSGEKEQSDVLLIQDSLDLNKLFFRARLKDCDGSSKCMQGTCSEHELVLTLDEFTPYSGRSMDAEPRRAGMQFDAPSGAETSTSNSQEPTNSENLSNFP